MSWLMGFGLQCTLVRFRKIMFVQSNEFRPRYHDGHRLASVGSDPEFNPAIYECNCRSFVFTNRKKH